MGCGGTLTLMRKILNSAPGLGGDDSVISPPPKLTQMEPGGVWVWGPFSVVGFDVNLMTLITPFLFFKKIF